MALAYVKPDVTRYLLGRRLEGLGMPGELHVIFPYPRPQPLPFAEAEADDRSDRPFTYPDEPRWWVWPLKYIEEIPLPRGIKEIIRGSPFEINSLSGGAQNTRINLLPPELTYDSSRADLEFLEVKARAFSIVIEYRRSYPGLFGESSSLDSDADPESGGLGLRAEDSADLAPSGGRSRLAGIARRISPKLARKIRGRTS